MNEYSGFFDDSNRLQPLTTISPVNSQYYTENTIEGEYSDRTISSGSQSPVEQAPQTQQLIITEDDHAQAFFIRNQRNHHTGLPNTSTPVPTELDPEVAHTISAETIARLRMTHQRQAPREQFGVSTNNNETMLPLLTRPRRTTVEQLETVVNRDREEDVIEEPQEQQEQQERQPTPGYQQLGEGPQQGIEAVLQQLAIAIDNMNQPDVPRESRIVDYPIFRGGEQDPNQWWQEFQQACVANQVTTARRLEIVPSYLKGTAHSWWNQINVRYWDLNTRPERSFAHVFAEKWCTTHHKTRWMNQLRNRVQLPGETVDEYLDDLDNLYRKADPTNRYPAEDKLRQFIQGLRDELREPVELSCPDDIAAAIHKARTAEAYFSRNAPLSLYSMRRSNNSNNGELQEIKQVITQLSQGFQQLATKSTNNNNRGNTGSNNNNQRETRTCNNCGKVGHLARYCHSQPRNNNNNNNNRRSFNNNNNNNRGPRTCYVCNQPGHISTNCPQRQSNNLTNRSGSSSNNNQTNNSQNHWLNIPMGDFLETAKKVKEHLN
jgi:hypothetical protein